MAKNPQFSKSNFWIIATLFVLVSCGPSSPQRHMTLAERFWSEENYQAAIQEYEKVIQKDTAGELSYVAKIRIASTYELFLNQPAKAIQYYEQANQQRPNSKSTLGTDIQIVEILINSLNDPVTALKKIEELQKKPVSTPTRIRLLKLQGTALAKQSRHQEYREVLMKIRNESPSLEDKAQAEFDLLSLEHTLLLGAGGSLSREAFKKLALRWNEFRIQYPNFERQPEAVYFQAWCLEEAGQIAEALKLFESIEKIYPAHGVITIKMTRIRERLERKGNAFGAKGSKD